MGSKRMLSEEESERIANLKFNSINDGMPPFVINSEGRREEFTVDVFAKTKSHGIVRTYHDGDVWCYSNLSGCPQYEVTHWAIADEDEDIEDA